MSPSVHPIPAIAPYTTLGLGGPAREFTQATLEPDLIDAVREADAAGTPVLILGAGSNLVVSDQGFPGRVVRVATRGITTDAHASRVHVCVAAGEPWDDLVAWTVARDLAGLECLSGIPGLAGSTPIQNVGAYGQEVADSVVSVRAWDRTAQTVVTLDHGACGFGYRDSVFKHGGRGRYVVLAVTFSLTPGGAPTVRYADLARAVSNGPSPTLSSVRDAVIALRRTRSMVLDPTDPESRSVGSFFTNPVVTAAKAHAVTARARAAGMLPDGAAMPVFPAPDGQVKLAAGWLIERAGIVRGLTLGGVAVSRRHALALVNRQGTTTELVALARHVRETVRRTLGVTLTPEPVFAGFPTDDPVSAA